MWTEERVEELLTTPSDALVEDIKKISGDIMVLGAGGKMGPSLCVLAKKAAQKAGINKRIIAVSRGSDTLSVEFMKKNGVEFLPVDLLDFDKIRELPKVENIIYMAGKKFGTVGAENATWAMNASLPAMVADTFKKSNIVVFSTGCVYPPAAATDLLDENVKPDPIGEYGMSCFARERAFQYVAEKYGTKVFIYRLSYAIDLRYGVLYDMANKILNGEPISLAIPYIKFVWQGYANEVALRALLHTQAPANIMNVSGPELFSVKKASQLLGKYLGKEPIFQGDNGDNGGIIDTSKATSLFGYPSVCEDTLIKWQAEYIKAGGRTLDKPTHFEVYNGQY